MEQLHSKLRIKDIQWLSKMITENSILSPSFFRTKGQKIFLVRGLLWEKGNRILWTIISKYVLGDLHAYYAIWNEQWLLIANITSRIPKMKFLIYCRISDTSNKWYIHSCLSKGFYCRNKMLWPKEFRAWERVYFFF